MDDITKLTDAELTAELARRAVVKKAENEAVRAARWRTLLENKTAVLSIVKHSRTSCNDENMNNKYVNNEGYPRCNRCWLLEELSCSSTAEEFATVMDISFEITLTPVKE